MSGADHGLDRRCRPGTTISGSRVYCAQRSGRLSGAAWAWPLEGPLPSAKCSRSSSDTWLWFAGGRRYVRSSPLTAQRSRGDSRCTKPYRRGCNGRDEPCGARRIFLVAGSPCLYRRSFVVFCFVPFWGDTGRWDWFSSARPAQSSFGRCRLALCSIGLLNTWSSHLPRICSGGPPLAPPAQWRSCSSRPRRALPMDVPARQAYWAAGHPAERTAAAGTPRARHLPDPPDPPATASMDCQRGCHSLSRGSKGPRSMTVLLRHFRGVR